MTSNVEVRAINQHIASAFNDYVYLDKHMGSIEYYVSLHCLQATIAFCGKNRFCRSSTDVPAIAVWGSRHLFWKARVLAAQTTSVLPAEQVCAVQIVPTRCYKFSLQLEPGQIMMFYLELVPVHCQ